MWELQAPGRAKEQDAFCGGGGLISRGLPPTRGEGRSACLWARLALFCRRINLCEINTSSCYFQVVLPAFRVQIHNGRLVNMCGMQIEEEARGVGGGDAGRVGGLRGSSQEVKNTLEKRSLGAESWFSMISFHVFSFTFIIISLLIIWLFIFLSLWQRAQ